MIAAECCGSCGKYCFGMNSHCNTTGIRRTAYECCDRYNPRNPIEYDITENNIVKGMAKTIDVLMKHKKMWEELKKELTKYKKLLTKELKENKRLTDKVLEKKWL